MAPLGLRSAVGPATGSIAVSSVTGAPSYPNHQPPTAVVDGDVKTYWAGNPASNEWALIFDFGNSVPLSSMQVAYFSGRYQAKETQVLLSDDGKTWAKLGTLVIGEKPDLEVNRTIRYLKLQMTGRLRDKQPAITEVTFLRGIIAAAAPVEACPLEHL